MRLLPRQSPTPAPYVVPPSQEFDGNDGSWSTFKINIGTPGQDFRVLASTKSGETLVVVPDGCVEGVDPSDCPEQRGVGVFNSQQSRGFTFNASSTWSTIGQYQVQLESALNSTAPAMYGYDRVALGSASDSTSLSLEKQVVGGVADTNYFLGQLPLGVPESSFSSLSKPIDSFLYQLRNSSKIPSLSFAYTAGAKYRLKSVPGQLILGGYDSTRFKANTNPFSFSFSTDASRLLTVGVESITATNTLKGTYSLSSGSHFSLVDSTVSHLWLPRDICDSFEAAFGLTYDPNTELYLINSTMRDQLKARNPSVTIKLVNSMTDTTTNYTNIILPYSAFDLQASYPYYQNATNYFPIRRAANDTQYTLGRTLLQEAYLVVDYERANFTISQAAFPDPLPAAKYITITSKQDSSTTNDSKSGLSTAAIAGIAVGAVLLIALAIAGLLFYRRRRRTHSQKYELANTQIAESASAALASSSPHKEPSDPQELGGTPLTELATPRGADKPFLSANDVPQELETPLHGTHPRWREVTPQHYYEMDGESTASHGVSRGGSRAPSEDGRYSGVSPLTGRFH